MLHKRIVLILIALFQLHPMHAVTLVYNLKIRQIFKVPAVLERLKNRKLLTLVPVFFARNSHIVLNAPVTVDVCEKRRAGGSLINFRYVYDKHWWIEATTGLETDHGTYVGSDPLKASRTGFDDIVIEAGYRYFWGDRVQLVGYGLVGIPTRRKITRCDRFGPLVGTRLYGLGCGFEQSYSFINESDRTLSFILQERFIHEFNRNWFPILPEGSKIQPGNFTDVLVCLEYRKKTTIFEIDYNPTIFTHQAVILPTQTIKTDTFVRHSGSLVISHGWFDGLFSKPTVLGAGCTVSTMKHFDSKTATAWIYGTIVF
jgi:hypothetical protein